MESETGDTYVPLSVRHDPGTADSYASALHEGVPSWLRPSLRDWVVPFVTLEESYYTVPNVDVMRSIERRLRLEGLPSDRDQEALFEAFLELIETGDEGVLLDVVDHCLRFGLKQDEPSIRAAENLLHMLQQAGSAWTPETKMPSQLLRRVEATANEAFQRAVLEDDRASEHLRTAWLNTYARNPDPSKAYAEAVKAIEASAKPVILPTDGKATLGKMIKAMKDKPEKWRTVFDHAPSSGVEHVASMMELVWRGHSDRHGTGDAEESGGITPIQAEAAVQASVALVHWFRSGVVTETQ